MNLLGCKALLEGRRFYQNPTSATLSGKMASSLTRRGSVLSAKEVQAESTANTMRHAGVAFQGPKAHKSTA